MTMRQELIELFCQMHEGWLPDVGKVYTVTLDHRQRTALMAILQDGRAEEWMEKAAKAAARASGLVPESKS